jgi:hypothetical protein
MLNMPRRCAGLRRAHGLALLLLMFVSPVFASETCLQSSPPSPSPPAAARDTELGEVLVEAGRSTRRTKDLNAWLARMEGQYRYEGHVDLCGDDPADRHPVTGKADCLSILGSRETQGSLYCVVDVRLAPPQDSVTASDTTNQTRLSPAIVVYNVLTDLPGIQSMQIDDNGIATHSQGRLRGDTLVTTGPCGHIAHCRRQTRITALPAGEEIRISVDFEVGTRRIQRHVYTLHRESNVPPVRPLQYKRLWREDLLEVGER